MTFGKNKYLPTSQLNDSTSQILSAASPQSELRDGESVLETISLHQIIHQHKLSLKDVSLIKVDIEGGEEHLLPTLFTLKEQCPSVRLYISFHHHWWENRNLDRFRPHLTDEHIASIHRDPLCSILF